MSSSEALSWLIAALVIITLAAFAAYLVGLRSIPVDTRPRTPIYDRLGRQIGEAENPDFHVSPSEDEPNKHS